MKTIQSYLTLIEKKRELQTALAQVDFDLASAIFAQRAGGAEVSVATEAHTSKPKAVKAEGKEHKNGVSSLLVDALKHADEPTKISDLVAAVHKHMPDRDLAKLKNQISVTLSTNGKLFVKKDRGVYALVK